MPHKLKELGYVFRLDAVDLGKDDLEGNAFMAELPQEEDIILFEAVSGVYEEEGAAEPAVHHKKISCPCVILKRVTWCEGRYCFLDFKYFMICTPHSSLEACP